MPVPDGVAHVLSPLRNVVADGVPVADSIGMSTAPLAMVAVTEPVPEPVTSPVRAVIPPPVESRVLPVIDKFDPKVIS